MFHPLSYNREKVNLPRRFTFPFSYTPHPLSVAAANEVRRYLLTQPQWERELAGGKMFGVLVVQTESGALGFLAAFSGQLANSYLHEYFVPPVYDLNAFTSFFRSEEQVITELNQQIQRVEESAEYEALQRNLSAEKNDLEEVKRQWKERLSAEKIKRDEKRKTNLTEDEVADLIRQSQFLKAEAKRQIKAKEVNFSQVQSTVAELENNIASLKQKRKQLSNDLQHRLFKQFVFANAKSEHRSLVDIFAPDVPPSGAGECAAPKLLQYAYLNHLRPICMAEFWWGKSPKGLVRRHGEFYPACVAKCRPILTFMLQGLEVDKPQLRNSEFRVEDIPILYEDDYLLLVNKPHGLQTVPGVAESLSLETLLRGRTGCERCRVAHRLDMSTSGLVVVAKNMNAYKHLQSQFESRMVEKRYLALLERTPQQKSGKIVLPICADWEHRPCQMVSYELGKYAETDYEVIGENDGKCRVYFYPKTGRTHQLRLHAAHPDGLDCPIVGDPLYGTPSSRLFLQAQKITFRHPETGREMIFELPFDF